MQKCIFLFQNFRMLKVVNGIQISNKHSRPDHYKTSLIDENLKFSNDNALSSRCLDNTGVNPHPNPKRDWTEAFGKENER